MKSEMLINVSQPEECRIAIVEDGLLEELYIERASADNYVGNIYKGRIVNLEPSIQAAFVDFGVGRNGFLHISDVEPQYFRQGGFDPGESLGFGRMADIDVGEDEGGDDRGHEEGGPRREERPHGGRGPQDRGGPRSRGFRGPPRGGRPRIKPPIQEIFRRGDEVLVQVIKEGIGTKGPTLSTYISIPGRYLVLMPALGRVGVSRKIEDDHQRRVLRDIMLELNPPKGLGFIVRTAGQERTKKELSRDLAYLLRLWKVIVRRLRKSEGPGGIYEESDMIIRTIRDIFTQEIDAIFIDEPKSFERAKEFLTLVMPRFVNRLQLYEGREPLFHKYKLENEIASIYQRKVPLKAGGSIVIDQTEALVAIDVNSGSFRHENDAEETAFQLNIAAAKEIARQLRLRDLGGVIVNDFIDMRRDRHRRGVERALHDAMRRDRARTKILRTSPFGLIEMTRQRIRPSLKRSVYGDCPCCSGRGVVKTPESMSIEVVRLLAVASQQPKISRVTVRVNDEVATYLNNKKRREIMQLEDEAHMLVQILGSESHFPEHLEIECRDAEGREITLPK
jgi:ribonuclease E